MDEPSSNLSTPRCAIVMGANKGIGFEICKQLVENGVMVVMTARDEKRGLQALQNLKASSHADDDSLVIFHQLDVAEPASVASVFDFVNTRFGKLDILRIGNGLILFVISMVTAALVEIKRRNTARDSGLINSNNPLPITLFWIAFQYLFLGSADLFTLAGLLEFFFTEAPISMRSLATSLSWASLAMGYYLSTVIVSIVNSVTGDSEHQPWLSGNNLNHYRLDLFYWLISVLSLLNFLHYLLWALKYKYTLIRPHK